LFGILPHQLNILPSFWTHKRNRIKLSFEKNSRRLQIPNFFLRKTESSGNGIN
jgi:hypothetical protein